MKPSVMVIGCFIALAGTQTFGQTSPYYYGGGRQIPLKIDSTRIVIKFDSEVGLSSTTAILNGIGRISSVLNDDHAVDGFVVCSLITGSGYTAFLDSVQALNGVSLVEPYY